MNPNKLTREAGQPDGRERACSVALGSHRPVASIGAVCIYGVVSVPTWAEKLGLHLAGTREWALADVLSWLDEANASRVFGNKSAFVYANPS